MKLPLTQIELLHRIAVETARMSYPGSMSRGQRPVVFKNTKKTLETYFCEKFPLLELWTETQRVFDNFEEWHCDRVKEISIDIASLVPDYNSNMSVSAKFLNTFLHQLMKYEQVRPIFPKLHLPLDSRVFGKLKYSKSKALAVVKDKFRQSPYVLSYEDHKIIQDALLGFIAELNERKDVEFKISSRIELNWLWL